jgi:hypothetical protein
MGTWKIVGTAWKVSFRGKGGQGPVSMAVLGVFLLVGALDLLLELSPLPQEGILIVQLIERLCIAPLLLAVCLVSANTQLTASAITATAKQVFQQAGNLYLRLLGTMALLTGIWMGVIFMWIVIEAALAGQPRVVAILATLVSVTVIGCVFYAVSLTMAMAPVAIALENSRMIEGIRKGLRMARAHLGKLLLVSVALTLTLIPPICLVSLLDALQSQQANLGLDEIAANLLGHALVGSLSLQLFAGVFVQLYRSASHPASLAV